MVLHMFHKIRLVHSGKHRQDHGFSFWGYFAFLPCGWVSTGSLPGIIFISLFRLSGDQILSKKFMGLLCKSKVAVSGWLPFDPDIPGGPTSISLPEARSRLVVQKPKAGHPL